jgi:phospholipase/lecithinase/hemolysin
VFTLALLTGHQGLAKPAPFSRIIIFGDSLSDVRNYFQLTGGQDPLPPYFEGRFSNGPLWIEYLAEDLGMDLLPEDNYAVSGATTGTANLFDGFLGLTFPGMRDQIVEFLASLGPEGADPDALYVVGAGSNDFFIGLLTGAPPETWITEGVQNTVQSIMDLWTAGARHILVLNVPDLGLSPLGLQSGQGDFITALTQIYNQSLEGALQDLADAGIVTIPVDTFATLRAMVSDPGEFGFANVTDPFLLVDGDPDDFLFWDDKHATTRAHRILATEAARQMIDHYSPRKGKGNPPSLIRSLRGLVKAARRH